jgi:alcohol dehydrogenase class IV
MARIWTIFANVQVRHGQCGMARAAWQEPIDLSRRIADKAGMLPFRFNTTPSVIFGAGSAARLGEAALPLTGRRVLLVSDAGLLQAGLLDGALASLEAAGIVASLFTNVAADPPEHCVLAAAEAARQAGATGIIGFGGGSPMDVAKLVALLARSGEDLRSAYGVGQAKGPRMPLVLVPTTAGTGSEVTPIAIVTTGEAEKKGVVSPILLPDLAILDPDLTLGLPAAVTAATGVDAMVHAIEAFTSASANNNPVSRCLAREALALLGRHIERAVSHGSDQEARGAMLLGSMLAGQAFANSPVAAVHALAYPVGGIFHVPHGLSNALVLPHVLAFNAPAAARAYAELAPIIFPDLAPGISLADAFRALSLRLGLPQRLRDVGIPRDAIPRLGEDAMKQTRLLVNNPRPLALADALAIYEAAW